MVTTVVVVAVVEVVVVMAVVVVVVVVVEVMMVVVVSLVVGSGASRSVFTQGEVPLARATRRSRTSPFALPLPLSAVSP